MRQGIGRLYCTSRTRQAGRQAGNNPCPSSLRRASHPSPPPTGLMPRAGGTRFSSHRTARSLSQPATLEPPDVLVMGFDSRAVNQTCTKLWPLSCMQWPSGVVKQSRASLENPSSWLHRKKPSVRKHASMRTQLERGVARGPTTSLTSTRKPVGRMMGWPSKHLRYELWKKTWLIK